MSSYPDPTGLGLVTLPPSSSSAAPAPAQGPAAPTNAAVAGPSHAGPDAPSAAPVAQIIDPFLLQLPLPALPAAPIAPAPPPTHQQGPVPPLASGPASAPAAGPASAAGPPAAAVPAAQPVPALPLAVPAGPRRLRHHLYELANHGLVQQGDILVPRCVPGFRVEATVVAVLRGLRMNGHIDYIISILHNGVPVRAGVQAHNIEGPTALINAINGQGTAANPAFYYAEIRVERAGVFVGSLQDLRRQMP